MQMTGEKQRYDFFELSKLRAKSFPQVHLLADTATNVSVFLFASYFDFLMLLEKEDTTGIKQINDSIELLRSGHEYFQKLVELIDGAIREIHIQTYIFNNDVTGLAVVESLKKAALRGVSIYVLVDSFGSNQLDNAFLQDVRQAGIHFKRYGKLLSKGRLHISRRLHRKVVVIDGVISIVGGINIGNNYNDLPGKPAWLDFAVLIRGNTSQALLKICRKRWRGVNFSSPVNPPETGSFSNGFSRMRNVRTIIRQNDFIGNKNEIAAVYRKAIRQAKSSLLIVGGYFLPGGSVRRQLRKACANGVQISVILPERSDVLLMVAAQHFLYAWMIRNGIKVYEYRPSNVHGKVIIVDSEWLSIGSYDLNNLSTYSNIELNLEIPDRSFSESFTSELQKIIREDCRLVRIEEFQKHVSWLRRVKYWISYRLVKTLFYLSWWLSKSPDKNV